MSGLAEVYRSDRRQEYQDYLPLSQRVQQDLSDDVGILQDQEGWDQQTREGVAGWVNDTSSIWRALRRNRYDEEKTLAFLLTSLTQRVSLSLHDPIRTSPLAHSPLFFYLPMDQYHDKQKRPIAVLSLREIHRDVNGKLDEMKEWVWWSLELGRRALRDSHDQGRGFVLLVDAEGAGYRNLEVELLPTVLSVGHNNFPGLIEAIYVVNAGWTHRNMWKVVKRVLPKSTLDKIAFLDGQADVEKLFELERLPKPYGGTHQWTFAAEDNPILKRYSVGGPSSAPSSSSQSDSRRLAIPPNRTRSRRPSFAIRMTKSSQSGDESDGRRTESSETPLQRIKSLSDFHLYLSPSRLANIDLLSDSDDEETPPRGIAARRAKAGLKPPALDRTYSSRLQEHHAKGVEMYSKTPPKAEIESRQTSEIAIAAIELEVPEVAITTDPDVGLQGSAEEDMKDEQLESIPAFSQDDNPWFGYPAVRVSGPGSSSVRPRYDRNRKRDLVKTLLFLFVLRVQSMRDTVERMLGLARRGAARESLGPSEGLMRLAGRRRDVSKRVDWTWMIVGLLLFRASWTRLIAAPLEALGLETVRDMLGLV